ncbi:MAG: hypothetical protein ACLQNE_19740 [Thermoguttaceae bacterium]|jgi:hypothetical protein
MTSQPLSHELAIYDRLKDEWVGAHEGKFVLIHQDDEPSIWDTYNDALTAGYREFGMDPFLVKQIRRIEQVQFITRDLTPCQS